MLDLLLNHSPAFVGGELLLALSIGMFGFALMAPFAIDIQSEFRWRG